MGRKSQFCTILFYEMKKILTARTTLILFIFIAAYSVIQGKIQANQLDDFDIETRDLQRSIAGRPIDDALIAETAEAAYKLGMPFECWDYSNCIYMNLSHWLKQIADDNSKLTDYNSESIYQARDSSVSESMNSMKLTENEKEYLLFMTTLLLSQIFAGEIKDKTDSLIKCTVGGWGDTYLAKVTAAFICTLFLNIVIEAVTVLTSFFLWGKDTWNIPIQLFMPLTAYSMTIGQFIRAQLVMTMATCILLTAVTCFLSEILKNPVAVMSGVFGSFLIINISSNRIPYSRRVPSQLLCLLSPIYMTSESALCEYRLIGRSGHYLTALQFAPILYIVLSTALIASGYFIYTNKK